MTDATIERLICMQVQVRFVIDKAPNTDDKLTDIQAPSRTSLLETETDRLDTRHQRAAFAL